jgi:hypothetical protein
MGRIRMQPRPFRQGALDSLCGVYAVINATRLAAWPGKRLTEDDCTKLFGLLTAELAAERRLHEVMTGGSAYPVVSRLLRSTAKWLRKQHALQLSYQRPFHSKPDIRGRRALGVLAAHLDHPQTSAIVYLAERWCDHWSVARSVSPSDWLLLFDSGRRQYARFRPFASGRTKTRIMYRDLFLIRAE